MGGGGGGSGGRHHSGSALPALSVHLPPTACHCSSPPLPITPPIMYSAPLQMHWRVFTNTCVCVCFLCLCMCAHPCLIDTKIYESWEVHFGYLQPRAGEVGGRMGRNKRNRSHPCTFGAGYQQMHRSHWLITAATRLTLQGEESLKKTEKGRGNAADDVLCVLAAVWYAWLLAIAVCVLVRCTCCPYIMQKGPAAFRWQRRKETPHPQSMSERASPSCCIVNRPSFPRPPPSDPTTLLRPPRSHSSLIHLHTLVPLTSGGILTPHLSSDSRADAGSWWKWRWLFEPNEGFPLIKAGGLVGKQEDKLLL